MSPQSVSPTIDRPGVIVGESRNEYVPAANSSPDPQLTGVSKPGRLISLDIFRGITMAAMLLVNNPGPTGGAGVYWPLEHAEWNGWTPTDLVFPFFVFIMGVAIPFSFAKRRVSESRGEIFLHVLARGISLFLLGEIGYSIPAVPSAAPVPVLSAVRIGACLFLALGFILLLYPWKSRSLSLLLPPVLAIGYLAILFGIHFFNHYLLQNGAVPADYAFGSGIFNPDQLRIPGVLQRIAVCYVAAATLALIADWRGIAAALLILLAGYSLIMLKVPYPSLSPQHPGQIVHGVLERQDNLPRYVDLHVFGAHVYHEYPDPEGLLSTFPAIGTALLGLLAGRWLRSSRSIDQHCAGLLAFGVLAVLIGEILNFTLMPINKRLWSPSYVFLAAGLASFGLGTLFYLCDILSLRSPFKPFIWLGMNAITAFVLSGIVARLLSVIPPSRPSAERVGSTISHSIAHLGQQISIGDPIRNGSLAYALVFVLFFIIITGILYRLRIFLKV